MSSTSALSANTARVGWSIQNLGTNPLFVLMGIGASTAIFHFVCRASTVQDDGTGGTAGQDQGIIFTGPVTVAGNSPRYALVELAP